ncbi:hypothetical protein EDC02_5022 [Micromonospora sp. Llam0]|uniref:hypothetical protein n=1 Tax=Micromonospora sp. Llam0 TaxID=2485143 RepID=UPI000F48B8D4|nr:hypothetical protein [Micromonospora sp. Llam0]ROO63012.1 hypothetical protein EDC02_5022 [Micromonospora sp. Llam0]
MTTFSAASADRRHPTPIPVPAQPPAHESIAATWIREIADAVAAALDTTHTDAGYLLTLHDGLPAPRLLQARFTVAGHRVDIDVRWPTLWQAPRFALRVDDHEITIDEHPRQRPAITLAHAAWLAILNTPGTSAGDPVTAATGTR